MLLKKRPLFDKFYDKFFGIFCRSRNIVNRNEYIYCYCHQGGLIKKFLYRTSLLSSYIVIVAS